MKFRELKKSLTTKIMPIYLVSGDDAFLSGRAVRLIIDACKIDESLNFTKYEGNEVKGDSEKLISALTSYPFMDEKRVVLVKEYYPLASDLKAIKSYFENPCDTTVFIIANVSSSENLNKLSNITVVDCAKGDSELAGIWIKSEVKSAGLTITQSAVDKIVDYSYSDMTKINGEVQKLISYALSKGNIEEKDVESLCVKELDYQTYEVVEFIANKNYEKAYACLTEMFTASGDGQKLFVSIYYYFRRLLHSAISNLSDAEVAKQLKIKEYAVKMSRRQAKSFSVKRLKEIVDTLTKYDEDFKQGKIDPSLAVWNGIFNVLVG